MSQLVTLDLPERMPAGWQARVGSNVLGGSGLEKHQQGHVGGLVRSLSPTKLFISRHIHQMTGLGRCRARVGSPAL